MSIDSTNFDPNRDPLPELSVCEGEPAPHIGEIERVAVDDSRITVAGAVDHRAGQAQFALELYELAPYHSELDYKNLAPIAVQAGPSKGLDFSFTIERFDGPRDRYYSKFLVVARDRGSDGQEPRLVAGPMYPFEIEFAATYDYPYPRVPSKKGLQVQMVDDAVALRICHAALNVQFDRMMLRQKLDPDRTITFTSQGREFYFDRSFTENLDGTIKTLSDNGIVVYLILLLYHNADPNSAFPELVHPDTRSGAERVPAVVKSGEDALSFEAQLQDGIVLAFNTADAEGVAHFTAAVEFLTARYTRADQRYGRALGYIVGNEVDSQWIWQNMGEQRLERFMGFYERAVRIVYQAACRCYTGARVYISLDHLWNITFRDEPGRYYRGREVVEVMNRLSKAGGDFPWHIAYHPYPEDLTKPATWNDTTAIDSVETPRITFKNLHILRQYLAQERLHYAGAARRVILSEQGFHTPDLSVESQRLQAAAYAYAYYKVLFDEWIDAFILHRHVDSKTEFGLRLGLWSWGEASDESSAPGQKKYIYDVFRRIDTADALAVTAFALPIIGITSWSEAVPGFDPALLDRYAEPRGKRDPDGETAADC